MKGKCSDRIKEALNLRNMKPIELVEQSNIKKSALSQYMSGKITPRQKALDAMAKVLNVSPAWLMGDLMFLWKGKVFLMMLKFKKHMIHI